jgi:hypothetical protein
MEAQALLEGPADIPPWIERRGRILMDIVD